MTFFYGPLYLAVTCLALLARGVQYVDFPGDDFWIYFRIQLLYLVRQWIHMFASVWIPWYSDPVIDSRPALSFPFSVLCLVRLWIQVLRQSPEIFIIFYVNWWTMDPEVVSPLSLRTWNADIISLPLVLGSHLFVLFA